MKIREGAYYRTRDGRVIGPMKHVDYRAKKWKFLALGFNDGEPCWTDQGRWCEFDDSHSLDLLSEVYVSDTPPSDDVMLNLSEIARTKAKAMGEGNFGIDENPPFGIRLRWLVEVVDSLRDLPLLNVQETEDKWRARLLAAAIRALGEKE